jgi:hypothetical protein
MTPILGIMASQISGHLTPPSDFQSIATVTVGGAGQTTITFSSIAADWTHLQIRCIARANSASNIYSAGIRLNSDTGSNYSLHGLIGNGSAATAFGSASNSIAYVLNTSGTSTTDIFTANILDILDYADTSKYSTLRTLSGGDFNGAGSMQLLSSVWLNTDAITRIDILTNGYGDFLEDSTFALYGVK